MQIHGFIHHLCTILPSRCLPRSILPEMVIELVGILYFEVQDPYIEFDIRLFHG